MKQKHPIKTYSVHTIHCRLFVSYSRWAAGLALLLLSLATATARQLRQASIVFTVENVIEDIIDISEENRKVIRHRVFAGIKSAPSLQSFLTITDKHPHNNLKLMTVLLLSLLTVLLLSLLTVLLFSLLTVLLLSQQRRAVLLWR